MDICILLGILSFCQIIFEKDTFSFIPQLRVLKNKQQNLNCHGFICSLNKYNGVIQSQMLTSRLFENY